MYGSEVTEGYIFHFQRCPSEGFSIDLYNVASTEWFILIEVRAVNSGFPMKRSNMQVFEIKLTQLRVRYLNMRMKRVIKYF